MELNQLTLICIALEEKLLIKQILCENTNMMHGILVLKVICRGTNYFRDSENDSLCRSL